MTQKAVVAFSGGLDTSMLVPYIKEKYELSEVVTCTVDTGGLTPNEISSIRARASEVGSSEHTHIDASEDFYNEIIKYLIFGNVSRDGYPLCVGAERLIQAREVVKHARQKKIDTVVHGSTGAGNDQYRFDLVAYVLGQGDAANGISPIRTLAPVRDDGIKREFSQQFLRDRGVSVSPKTTYSYNVGLWGVSIGGKETHTSEGLLPDDAWYSKIDTTILSKTIEIDFVQGEPKVMRLDGKKIEGSVPIIKELAIIAGSMGIGRHYHVGTSIPGKKGRVAYESPAADVLYEAHTTLEKLTLTQEQIFFKKSVSTEFGRLIHEAKFFDPLINDLRAYLDSSQIRVTGTCTVYLKQGRIDAVTVNTPYDLLSASGSVYGEYADFYSAPDALGSCKINAYEQVIYHGVKKKTA
jgi:argininosuccinate synthase